MVHLQLAVMAGSCGLKMCPRKPGWEHRCRFSNISNILQYLRVGNNYVTCGQLLQMQSLQGLC